MCPEACGGSSSIVQQLTLNAPPTPSLNCHGRSTNKQGGRKEQKLIEDIWHVFSPVSFHLCINHNPETCERGNNCCGACRRETAATAPPLPDRGQYGTAPRAQSDNTHEAAVTAPLGSWSRHDPTLTAPLGARRPARLHHMASLSPGRRIAVGQRRAESSIPVAPLSG